MSFTIPPDQAFAEHVGHTVRFLWESEAGCVIAVCKTCSTDAGSMLIAVIDDPETIETLRNEQGGFQSVLVDDPEAP